MIVGIPKETAAGEHRVAASPDAVRALVRADLAVVVEAGAGAAAGFRDAAYEEVGASIEADQGALYSRADAVLAVQGPADEAAVGRLRQGSVLIGLLRPLDQPEAISWLAERRVTAFAMELMPRITRAQGMDALSSQANLAGYRSVLVAGATIGKVFPMMVTAAGTISPGRVLVLGAGVAGLQAIATAHRLGAIVEAYDVRPAVKEQVESLGGRFVELKLETEGAEDAGGYAKAQSEEYYAKQRALLGEHVKACDVLITTALVPGKRAPLLVEEETIRAMRPGSVVVDLAAAQGGNCGGSRPDAVVDLDGVTVLGPTNLPSEVAFDASRMYGRNVTSFLIHLVDEGKLALDLEDELTAAPLVSYEGKIVNEAVRAALEGGRS